jgi:hypothetical protein
MKARCYQPNNDMFPAYGGRGIKICQEWLNDPAGFVAWALVHGYRKGVTIERRDVNGDYCPENCEWIEASLQNCNKTNSRFVEYRGEKLTISQWAKRAGISTAVLHGRLFKCGWPMERAMSAPLVWSKAA